MKPNPYQPGEAYALAMQALKDRQFDRARELMKFMVKSDRILMTKRIGAADTTPR